MFSIVLDPVLQLRKIVGLVRFEKALERLMRALIFTLRRGFSWQSTDRHGALRGQEDLHRSDLSLPQLVEGQGIITQDLLGRPVGVDCPCQHVLGIATVLLQLVGPGTDVIAGCIIEQLVDGSHLAISGAELEGVELA